MNDAGLDFGSLNDTLANADPYRNVMGWLESDDEFRKQHPDTVAELHKSEKTGKINLMRSAGPVSDAYILSFAPMVLIVGPGGSGKTIASGKKSLVETQRMRPGPDGVRRYVLGTWRQKYVNVWKATIPSWWKLFPRTLSGSKWEGSSPREAQHTIAFEDKWGRAVLVNRFRAFGEAADPDDVLGNEFTDCYLNEWPTLPEELMIALVDRIGREPPREISGRVGRMWGDGNAPDVLSYVYRDWYEEPTKPGHVLFRQPSGLSPYAENIEAVGRDYYLNSAQVNAHRPWWIKRMIHAQPGFTRAVDPVWPQFDDDRNMARSTIPVIRELPVLVGIDGGMTPAASYAQERGDGQLRILAEMPLERGGMKELSTAMLAIEATARFAGCSYTTVCDPAMGAGEDLAEGSDRGRLSTHLGRRVELAPTQNTDARHEAMRSKFAMNTATGEPGCLIDPSCKAIRRGANQTFAFRNIHGTNDRSMVEKTFDSHVCEATEYLALLCGTALAKERKDEIARKQRERREEARNAPRYNPMAHRRSRVG